MVSGFLNFINNTKKKLKKKPFICFYKIYKLHAPDQIILVVMQSGSFHHLRVSNGPPPLKPLQPVSEEELLRREAERLETALPPPGTYPEPSVGPPPPLKPLQPVSEVELLRREAERLSYALVRPGTYPEPSVGPPPPLKPLQPVSEAELLRREAERLSYALVRPIQTP